MLISPRPLNLKFKERGKEKTRIVLSWLLEWRVSPIDVLSAVIGLAPTASTRFFKKLLARNIIERIKVNNCDKRDLVILGPEGHKILGTSNIASAAELNRVRKYTKKKTVQHDIDAQKAVLKLMNGAMEIVSDFNIKMTEKKPDALVYRWSPKQQKVLTYAVEMERSAKGSKAIYFMLNRYLDLIKKGQVSKVIFIFSNKEDRATYKRYFDRDMWPYTGEKLVKDKLLPATFMKTIATNDPIREAFIFEYLDPNEDPVIFPLEKAAKLERVFFYPYLERIKDAEREPLIKQALEEAEKIKEAKEDEERAREEEEEEERKAVQERIGKRRLESASLYEALEKARAEDNSLKAWKPGYKFQTETVLEKIIAHLTEHLEREEDETLQAYELE